MEMNAGPLRVRTFQTVLEADAPPRFVPMTVGPEGRVIGHAHHFDHTTFIWGTVQIDILEPLARGMDGLPTEFRIVSSHIVTGPSAVPFFLVEKGVWHQLTALAENSAYMCAFTHRDEQPVTVFEPGQVPQKPYFYVDEDGDAWERVQKDIVQVANGFALAYQ